MFTGIVWMVVGYESLLVCLLFCALGAFVLIWWFCCSELKTMYLSNHLNFDVVLEIVFCCVVGSGHGLLVLIFFLPLLFRVCISGLRFLVFVVILVCLVLPLGVFLFLFCFFVSLARFLFGAAYLLGRFS